MISRGVTPDNSERNDIVIGVCQLQRLYHLLLVASAEAVETWLPRCQGSCLPRPPRSTRSRSAAGSRPAVTLRLMRSKRRAPTASRNADAVNCGSWDDFVVAARVMFVQLKTGHGVDAGPCWISVVRFNRSWKTAYWHGKTLRRGQGMFDANFLDIDAHEEYWLSGPHRDRRDTRYGNVTPTIDDDAQSAYKRFLAGAPLPRREHG
jgi:hypothetical protein